MLKILRSTSYILELLHLVLSVPPSSKLSKHTYTCINICSCLYLYLYFYGCDCRQCWVPVMFYWYAQASLFQLPRPFLSWNIGGNDFLFLICPALRCLGKQRVQDCYSPLLVQELEEPRGLS